MEREKIDAYFDDPSLRQALVNAVARLVAVPSVAGEPQPGAPFGPGPKAALTEALALCADLGLSAQSYDDYVGVADLNGGETQLHILAHLDVVAPGEGWDTDPYTCVERDGLLYGRGVSDDKGPLCAALFAMKAVKDLGGTTKNVRLILGTDEESGSSDIAYYYAHEPYAPWAFTPDADFPVIHIEKGHYYPDFGAAWPPETATPRVAALQGGFRTNVVPPRATATVPGLTAREARRVCDHVTQSTAVPFDLTDTPQGLVILASGKNAHAASPDDGRNAIQALLEVLARLPLADCPSTRHIRGLHALFPFGDTRGRGLGIAQEDAESGPLTLNLALLEVTETGLTAKFDCRFPLCANEANCKAVCESALARHGLSVTGDREMRPAHSVPADSPLVRTLLDCYALYTGHPNPKPMAIGGGTYVHNIPGGVAFGCVFPGFDPKMHGANEQARVDHLLLSAKIFTHAIFELCEGDVQ